MRLARKGFDPSDLNAWPESWQERVRVLAGEYGVDPIIRTKAAPGKAEDLNSGEFLARISDETVDHDGEIVRARGLDLSVWNKNKVLLFGHDAGLPTIGKGVWAKAKKDADGSRYVLMKARFSEANPLGAQMRGQYEEGTMSAFSIGFLPTDVSFVEEKDVDKDPSLEGARAVIEKGILLEVSAVPVPANQNALVMAIQKGLVTHPALLAEVEQDEVAADPVAVRETILSFGKSWRASASAKRAEFTGASAVAQDTLRAFVQSDAGREYRIITGIDEKGNPVPYCVEFGPGWSITDAASFGRRMGAEKFFDPSACISIPEIVKPKVKAVKRPEIDPSRIGREIETEVQRRATERVEIALGRV